MLEADSGQEAVVDDPAPAVGGAQEAQVAGSGTEPPVVPGYIRGQLDKETSEALLAEIKADPELAKRLPKDPTDVFKQWRALDKASKGALRIPEKDAPKEVWDQFYKGLGRPDSAEAYALEKPQIPAGMRYNEAQEKWFRGVAHALGLNQVQAQGLFAEFNKIQTTEFQKTIAARQAQRVADKTNAETVLKQKYKDAYLDKMESMKQAYMALMPGGQEGKLFKKVQALGLDNDPDFLQMWINIGEKIGRPRVVVPSSEGGGSVNDRPMPVFNGLKGLKVGQP